MSQRENIKFLQLTSIIEQLTRPSSCTKNLFFWTFSCQQRSNKECLLIWAERLILTFLLPTFTTQHRSMFSVKLKGALSMDGTGSEVNGYKSKKNLWFFHTAFLPRHAPLCGYRLLYFYNIIVVTIITLHIQGLIILHTILNTACTEHFCRWVSSLWSMGYPNKYLISVW